MKQIITRFAPSPTGYIHIGNVRSAIYPYLIARQSGGKFLLRIEDTDQKRFMEGATELILETLEWLGLEWDEGPKVSKNEDLYYQTRRKEIYHKFARKLIEAGRAYADPTPSEEIEKYRKEDMEKKIPYLYRNHRPENTLKWQPGIPLRFKAEPKKYSWTDEVMGEMQAGEEVLDDIILIKADGLPTYNFAHIVDDAEMGVTHICRGAEYLSSMPNYLALYEALGLKRPKFLSLPHILGPTGGKKLGKRDGAKSVVDYRKDGVLAEALVNYLACLGWNDGTEQEIYTREELLAAFSIDKIQSSPARFDEVKLLWTNGQWIRKIFNEQGVEALYERTAGFWSEEARDFSDEYKKQVLSIVYDRLKTLSELESISSYFFEDPKVEMDMIFSNKFLKKIEKTEMVEILNQAVAKLSEITDWNSEEIQAVLNKLLEKTGKKPAELFSLLRIAVSFAPFSPALNLTFEVLGKEVVLGRLEAAKVALSH